MKKKNHFETQKCFTNIQGNAVMHEQFINFVRVVFVDRLFEVVRPEQAARLLSQLVFFPRRFGQLLLVPMNQIIVLVKFILAHFLFWFDLLKLSTLFRLLYSVKTLIELNCLFLGYLNYYV